MHQLFRGPRRRSAAIGVAILVAVLLTVAIPVSGIVDISDLANAAGRPPHAPPQIGGSRISVTPRLPLLLKGQGTQFAATVRDGRGKLVPGVSLAWSVEPPGLGVVEADGFFTATKTGAGTVRVAADGVGVIGTTALWVYELSDLERVILPVMLVAADRTSVAGVRQGLARFRSVMENVRSWYNLRAAGQTFRFLEPIWVRSTRTAAQWDQISYDTATASKRYGLLAAAKEEYLRHFPIVGDPPFGDIHPSGRKLKIVLVPYTGDSPDVWLGAAANATGGQYLVAPQRATSVNCPPSGALDARCADAAYAIGHELGHLLGLDHTCQAYPSENCRKSLMEVEKPPSAILVPPEVAELTASPFFNFRGLE